jgi:hypothetical protein
LTRYRSIPVIPETFRFEDSAGGWSPSLSVIGRLQFDGRDVAAVLVEAAVVELMWVILVKGRS